MPNEAQQVLQAAQAERERRRQHRTDELRRRKDPLFFVETMFPWGVPDTMLAAEDGPDKWQVEVLADIRDGLLNINEAIQIAIASGHGVGKSCLVSWVILWAITTMEDARGIVTANTGAQLATKTWPELSKWFGLLKAKGDFKITTEAIYSVSRPLTWRIDAVTWNIDRPEAFAGLHNAGKRVVIIFDEASDIPDVIWETAAGAMTDLLTELIWLCFGNPTRNTGRFRECFGRFRHRWKTRQIDSRTAKRTNKDEIAKLVADYGEDHDIIRIRVRGIFPRAGSMQFIPSDIVEEAQRRTAPWSQPPTDSYDPVVMGVDVARSLDGDETVILIRRGRDAKSIPRVRMRVRDTMVIAARIVELANKHAVDAIFVDGGGVGGGVVDRLNQLRKPVFEIQFGSEPTGSVQSKNSGIVYFNKRAEMWGTMRDWLAGGYIEDDPDLASELTSVEHGYKQKNGSDAILLEKKEDMKKRGLPSPDSADALALTFALPVQRSDHSDRLPQAPRRKEEYDPFSEFER